LGGFEGFVKIYLVSVHQTKLHFVGLNANTAGRARSSSHHHLQQPRQIQARGLADFDDFGVMQRLWSQTGGPIGEHGDAGDLHAKRTGLNRLG